MGPVTVEINSDPWATLDELMGVEVVDTAVSGMDPMAFYGRCSTEDNQDPETSQKRAMPDAALAATVADAVLPLEEIQAFLYGRGLVVCPASRGGVSLPVDRSSSHW